jgi:hypothetical protein
MSPVRTVCALAAALACAAPAAADVTFKRKMDGKMMTGTMSGTSVQYVKGTKMRDDQTMAGAEMSSIIDVATQQMIALDHKRRQAEVYDMAKVGAEVAAKIPSADVQAKLTPTGETRQVAGMACTVHTMDVSAPMDMGGEKLNIRITGPVCVAKNGPGQADLAAFYKAVAEKGLFFGDVRAARAQPGQARGMTALYSEMAALGVPLAQEMTIAFEGGGPMAGMMSKMGGTSMSFEVLSVSTDPIPDATFEIPADYKVVKR